MRLLVEVIGGSATALPRIVSLLHRRSVAVTRLEYCKNEDGHHAVVLDVASPRPEHLIGALDRLVEVLHVRQVTEAPQHRPP